MAKARSVALRKTFAYGVLAVTKSTVWKEKGNPEAGTEVVYSVRFKVKSEVLERLKAQGVKNPLKDNPFLLMQDGASFKRFFSNGSEKITTYIKTTDYAKAEEVFKRVVSSMSRGVKPTKKAVIQDVLPSGMRIVERSQSEFSKALLSPSTPSKKLSFSVR
jgi:hypothetical protein